MNKRIELRRELALLTLDELADRMAASGIGSDNEHVAKADFLRRQSEAVISTATATRNNSNYMLASVVVLALGSLVTAGSTLYAAYYAVDAAATRKN